MNEVMTDQIAMLEDALEMAIENNLPPMISRFGINSPVYNSYLQKIANILFLYMDEKTGEIDGKKAQQELSEMFPSITQWISIPQKKFFIKDEINILSTNLIGRYIL